MVSTKTILFICLSSLAAGQDTVHPSYNPITHTQLTTPHTQTWTCANSQGQLRISQNYAISASHQAPLSDGKTKTSYPHWFTNGYDGDGNVRDAKNNPPIKFPVGQCNKPPKHSKNGDAKDDHYLLEFPLKRNGKLYPFDKKPKELTEPARVIYTWPDKVFCGIVAHTEGSNGPLELCHT